MSYGGIIGGAVVPDTLTAPGVWRPSQIARQLNGETQGLVWPSSEADASFSSVTILLHCQPGIYAGTGVTNLGVKNYGSLGGGYVVFGTSTPGGGFSPTQRKWWQYSFVSSDSLTSKAALTGGHSALGTGDFTIEMWVYPSALTGTHVPIDFRASGTVTNGPLFNITSAGAFILSRDGSTAICTSANGVIAANAWHHIAATRSGSTNRIYVNGNQVGSNGTDSTNYTNTTCYVGTVVAGSSANSFAGYIQEVRVTKGVARYTGATYTVPTTPFPDH